MNLATWSIRKPSPAVALFALVCAFGVIAFRALPINNLHDPELGQFEIALALPGASPEQLESEVARPVENALSKLQGVSFIRSRISKGVVLVRIDFDFDRDVTDAFLETKAVIDRIRGTLPVELEEPSYRQLMLAAGAPTVTYAVTSATMSEEQLSWFVEDTVSRAILELPEVGRFDQLGGTAREVSVDLDLVRLSAHHLTVIEVSEALARIQNEAAGGAVRIGGAAQSVRTLAAVRRAEDLANLHLAFDDGRRVLLSDIAEVRDGAAEATSLARLDGRAAVGFQVLRNKGADELELIEQVAAVVQQLEAATPGVSFELVGSVHEEVKTQFDNAMRMLMEGALLSILVTWLFIRDMRSTLIAAVALPLSILPTFATLYLLGYTLNTTTLLALTAVVGILVDDAIVEIENIARHIPHSRSIREATERAVNQIGRAVLATTLALVIVFVPTSFMEGFSGILFQQFGWTAVAAVLASLAVARLLTPMLASRFLKPRAPRSEGLWVGLYLRLADTCLRHGMVTLLVIGAFTALAAYLWSTVPRGFIPAADSSFTHVSIELPPGATINQTALTARQAEEVLMSKHSPIPGVEHIFTLVGQPSVERNGVTGGSSEVRNATLTVVLAPRGQRPTQGELESIIRDRLADLPGAHIAVNGWGFGERLELILSSRNPAMLQTTAAEIAAELSQLEGLRGVATSTSLEGAELVIRPDLKRAADLGVTTGTIAEAVRLATSGDFEPSLPKLNLDTRQIYVRVRLGPQARNDLEALSALRVPGREGMVPLSSVAELSFESGPLVIERYNGQRHISISADLDGLSYGEAMQKAAQLPSMASLPPDVQWVRGAEAGLVDELFANFGFALVVAAIGVYVLLVILFHDFLQPIAILAAAPLSIIGALSGVWLTDSAIGLPVLIGFVMLLGIAAKNSILLIDAALELQRQGKSAREAILEACHMRARAIVMTSVAMIAGLLPLVLGWGGSDMSFMRPLATTVMGGLVSSTILSLIAVPVLFQFLVYLGAWMGSIAFSSPWSYVTSTLARVTPQWSRPELRRNLVPAPKELRGAESARVQSEHNF